MDNNGITMKIDGFETNPYLVINNVSRPSYDVDNTTAETARDGVRVTNTKNKQKTITVECTLLSDDENDNMRVQDIEGLIKAKCDTKDDLRIIFSDFPDRYWVGRLDGNDSVEVMTENIGTLSLTFLIPDGKSHSIENKAFKFNDDEVVINNSGTSNTPLDIHLNFDSDANSVGIVSDSQIVQFGTTITEDEDDFVASERVIRDGMGPTYRNEWKLNVGRPRFKYDYGAGSSRVTGNVRWVESKVRISDFGTFKEDGPSYWHGPTLTRNLTESLDNFTAYFRFKMKPGGKRKNRSKSQGLLEINLMDADNNFVMGFGLKDNDPNKASVMYDFFVGDYRVFRGNLPKKVLKYTTGIFGYVEMSKVGNQFSFKLCHLKEGFRENWSVKKTYHNDSVAMLSFKTINLYGAQWKRIRDMITEWTSTTITKINTEDDSLVPLVFYEGDELFVDGQNNHVYINGIRDDNYRVIGSSQFLTAPVGKTAYSVLTDGNVEGYYEMREQYL